MVGQDILHYRITDKLGEGGMGVVYKALDTKLDRPVALKFLPQTLNTTEADRNRFIQEARAASALNHPNVCTIHDIQEHDGQLFLVMEFVDGHTLRGKKSLTLKQAVDIGMQIADGLAAAHEKGIVHRDIKPENIMVRKDGIVQIMDFGLAKLRGVSRLTREGSTVGTAGYMSPEQVQGQEADHRSDIFSLGVVLYEMFTGAPPFKGVHETAISYEIVNVDPPPMTAAVPDIDPALDAIVLECLAKERSERYQAVGEVGKELRRFKRESTRQRVSRTMTSMPVMSTGGGPDRPSGVASPPPQAPPGGTMLWKGLALGGFVVAAGLLAFMLLRPVPHAPSLHVELVPPPQTSYSVANGTGHFAISPDGHSLAFTAVDTAGVSLLWVRSFQSSTSRPIPGTTDAQYPFWSPDGKSIGYFTRSRMMKVDLEGGALFTISDVVAPRGAAWNRDGVIIFARDQSEGLSRIPATGGKAELFTRLDTTLNELTHRWPSFLPDQDHFLFFARSSLAGFGGDDRDHLYVGSLSKGTTQRIIPAVSDAQYAKDMILYIRENSIVGQAFDPDRLELRGDPVTIAQNVQYTPRWSRGSFSAAPNGMLCYLPGGQESRPEISVVRKDGSLVHRMGRLDLMFRASLSPDGSRVVMDLLDPQSRNIDVWVYDIARGMKTRLTFSKEPDLSPLWSPDGGSVAYASGMGRETRIVVQPVTGSGEERTVVQATNAFPSDWSPDSRYILYFLRGGNSDLWIAPLDGGGPPVAITFTEHNEAGGRFSPDMRWIAYQSDESGRNEVYVRSFVPPGRDEHLAVVKRQISSDGGGGPRWTADGRGITFVTPKGIMLAELKETTSMLEVLRVSPYSPVQASSFNDVLPAAGLLVTQSFQTGSGVIPLHLVVNWPADLIRTP